MIEDSFSNIYDLFDKSSDIKTQHNQNFKSDLGTIDKNYSSHYFYTKCRNFPFIKFCKDRKHIRLTCSCLNNKKILIDSFLQEYVFDSKENNIICSTINNDKDYEDILLCNIHKKKFNFFCLFFFINCCQDCQKRHFISFDNIKKENNKLFEKINDLLKNDDSSINTKEEIFSTSNWGNSFIEEGNGFQKLISIIINDYKKYPNFSHFFNLKNLLDFFNYEDKIVIEKEEEKIKNDIFIKNYEPIIIEYINNNPYKTKLFSKIFVKNNKQKFKLEIEGKILDLIDEYEFKRKDKKVRIKLFINNKVSEINLYKMFANCTNLVYVDGISKFNNFKIININKLFYNCINLSSLPDLNEFEIKNNNTYLMFFNCISLIFFPNGQVFKKYSIKFRYHN